MKQQHNEEEDEKKLQVEKKLKLTKKLFGLKRLYGSGCARFADTSTCSVRGSIRS